MKDKYYILRCSFGKDSLFLLNYILDNKYPIDEVQFVEPYFDKETSGILPIQKKFIENVIERYKSRVKFNIIKSELNYKELYLKYGVPSMRGCHWCTGWLKTKPLNKYNKELAKIKDIYFYIGYCANEQERALKNKNKKNIYPLIENRINEEQCYNYCKSNNLLAPTYKEYNSRDGCWFCPFQRLKQWELLKVTNNELFNKMCNLEQERYKINKKYALVRDKFLKDKITNGYQMTIEELL